MRHEKRLFLNLIFTLILLIGLGFVSAEPPMPCVFYGNFNYINGTFPDGNFITAKINDVVSGECEIANEQYGYGGSCIIVSYQDSVEVDFYLNDIEIGESIFEDKGIINLDFLVDFIPESSGILSNGICEEELNECAFNILDCNIIVTSTCIGNGVCDSQMGETCSNSPADCGACPIESNSGSSSSSSGGGGGSGSSTSTSSIPPTNETNETQITPVTVSIKSSTEEPNKELKEQEELEDTKPSLITGFVVSAFEGPKSIWTGFVVLILIIIGYFLFKKKKIKKSKSKKSKKKIKKINQ